MGNKISPAVQQVGQIELVSCRESNERHSENKLCSSRLGVECWANSSSLVKKQNVKKPNQSFGNGLIKRQRQWQRKRTMEFGPWNVQGLLNKINEVTHEIRERNVDVALITETKKKGQVSETLGNYDHFFSSVPKQKRAQQ